MLVSPSVSQWIANLKEGDAEAAQRLWERYAMRLVGLARRRMKDAPKQAADEEDIAASVFSSLCRGAAAGRFSNVQDRDELWWLLLAITKQKTVDHIRRESAQKRGAGRTYTESNSSEDEQGRRCLALDQIVGYEPTPEYVVMLQEQHQRLLSLLRDDGLRKIAVCRIEGFTISEIADDLQVSTRSVERKLKLIRDSWARELSS
jgi:RNA polymerase sigma factor (sigma-70 family)